MPHSTHIQSAEPSLEHDLSRAVKAPIGFLKKSALFDNEEPYAFRYRADIPVPQTNMETEYMDVEICDIRGQEERASLQTCGFQIKRLQSAMTYEQFNNPKEVEDVYLQDLKHLLLEDTAVVEVDFDRVRVCTRGRGLLIPFLTRDARSDEDIRSFPDRLD